VVDGFQQPGAPWASGVQPGLFDVGVKGAGPAALSSKIDKEARLALIPLVLTWLASSFIITMINGWIYYSDSSGFDSGYGSSDQWYARFQQGPGWPWHLQGTLTLIWTASAFLMWVPNVERFYARHILKMRKPLEREAALLEPAMADVLRSAGITEHTFELWVEDTDADNAYAAGRNIICVTRGALVRETPEQLRGTIAHELGHHLGWHARILSLQCWYLLPLELLCRVPFIKYLFSPILNGLLALMSAFGRPQEHRADLTAVAIGHGAGLVDYFYGALNEGTDDRRRFSSLMSRATATHPAIPDRIALMEAALKAQSVRTGPPTGIGQWQPNESS